MADVKFSEFPTSNEVDVVQVAGIQAGANTLTPIAGAVDNMVHVTLVEAMFTSEQSPDAIDTPKVIQFNETGSPIVSADGTITINTDSSITTTIDQAITALIKFQVGRTGSQGKTDWISFTTVQMNGTEVALGQPIHIEFDSASFNAQKDLTRVLQVPATSVIRFYWYNDSNDGGNNNGALQDYICTPGVGPEGADLPPVPSASIQIGRFESGIK